MALRVERLGQSRPEAWPQAGDVIRTVGYQAALQFLRQRVRATNEVAQGMTHNAGAALKNVGVQGRGLTGRVKGGQSGLEITLSRPGQKGFAQQSVAGVQDGAESRTPLGKSGQFLRGEGAGVAVGPEQGR